MKMMLHKMSLIFLNYQRRNSSLLEKCGKDRLIENWRPISLLNIDYKILTKCLTERVKKILEKLIDQSQTCFVKGRNISDGLRIILDVMDETDINKKEGLLVTIDFEKAFDSLSWDYLFKAIKTFNFGTDFLRWVKLCYTDISSCVMNFKHSSPYFSINRGVRQGDSLSPYLFILAVELMSINIRNDDNIRGLNYENNEIKILSYADDTTAILQDETDANKLFAHLKEFERISGLKMNKSKTEGLWLGIKKHSNFKPLGIKWKSVIKILGIHISYDKQLAEQKNFIEKIAKIKIKLNLWKQRNLSIYGKILIIKTFALSQILYLSTVLHIPDHIVKEIETLSYQFLWNGKQHKVKKRVITQDFEKGGCRMIDLEEMMKVQKIKLIIKHFVEKEKQWKYTMQTILGIKNLNLFLKSNFIIPPHVSPFYNDVLKFWKEVKFDKCEVSDDILSQYIWYNQEITINKLTLYNKHFIENGIIQIKDIINENGTFKNIRELNREFGINKNYFLFYHGLVNAIPKQWSKTINGNKINNAACYLFLKDTKIDIEKVKYDKIYSHLVQKKCDVSKANIKYSEFFNINDDQWEKIYYLPFKVNVSNKAKENQYKLIHDYIPTNKLLYKMNFKDSPRCNFCNMYEQNTCHMFYNCFEIKNFWFRVMDWLRTDHQTNVNIELKCVIIGDNNLNDFVNVVILYGKLFISKCKYNDERPAFEKFLSTLTLNQVLK